MCHVTVGDGRLVQVDIAYTMRVVGIDGTTDVPTVQRVKSDGEAHAEVGAPVAVDVFGS